ncbi:MAG: hypothetical protein OXU20_32350 [Myxococcales bacterium]|nr:hypothetical protein [Myxococcales bacterium]
MLWEQLGNLDARAFGRKVKSLDGRVERLAKTTNNSDTYEGFIDDARAFGKAAFNTREGIESPTWGSKRMFLGGGGEWMVESSPAALRRAYEGFNHQAILYAMLEASMSTRVVAGFIPRLPTSATLHAD